MCTADMKCLLRFARLVAAFSMFVASTAWGAEPMTASCNEAFQAPDIIVHFADSGSMGSVLAVVQNPASDPDLYAHLARPKSAVILVAEWAALFYDFDLLVDTSEVAAGLLSDPVLTAHGIIAAQPDHYGCDFSPRPPPGRVTITEYHNRILDHYFLSSSNVENQAIDSGSAGPGWERTGESYTASVGNACSDSIPVFRFYGAGPNSHFFTVDPAECGLLHNQDPGWQLEGNAFGARLPVNGACEAGWRPLYRLYNNRFAFNDSNHRYVVRLDLYQQMITTGWLGEGVAMCLPNQ